MVVEVHAAGLDPYDLVVASGDSYDKPVALPCVVGSGGVGTLSDGRRVYFESTVAPHGAAAERTIVEPQATVEPPDELDDAVAAALGNAGIAAWLSLQWRAREQAWRRQRSGPPCKLVLIPSARVPASTVPAHTYT
jgi:NADPH:quinone reductase-like Zn-dependent oxidoreductase